MVSDSSFQKLSFLFGASRFFMQIGRVTSSLNLFFLSLESLDLGSKVSSTTLFSLVSIDFRVIFFSEQVVLVTGISV